MFFLLNRRTFLSSACSGMPIPRFECFERFNLLSLSACVSAAASASAAEVVIIIIIIIIIIVVVVVLFLVFYCCLLMLLLFSLSLFLRPLIHFIFPHTTTDHSCQHTRGHSIRPRHPRKRRRQRLQRRSNHNNHKPHCKHCAFWVVQVR